MVFESMLVDILNRYLRPYVKRLDPSQIKVGVWKGESVIYTRYTSCVYRLSHDHPHNQRVLENNIIVDIAPERTHIYTHIQDLNKYLRNKNCYH